MYDQYICSLLSSLGIHVLLIIIAALSINYTNNTLPEERIITLDVVPVRKSTNVKTVVKKDRKSKQQQAQNTKKITAKKITAKNIIKEVQTSEKIMNNKRKITNKDISKPKDKQIQNEVKQIQHNLKNIEKKTNITGEADKKHNEALGKETIDAELSISERQLIHDAIDHNWERGFLLGVKNAENIQITVKILLSYDGSLRKEPQILSSACPMITDNLCNATMVSVKRAIVKAFPIKGLSAERYNVWKEISLIFSPE